VCSHFYCECVLCWNRCNYTHPSLAMCVCVCMCALLKQVHLHPPLLSNVCVCALLKQVHLHPPLLNNVCVCALRWNRCTYTHPSTAMCVYVCSAETGAPTPTPPQQPRSLRLVCSAAAALPHALALQLRQLFDAVVLPCYGMTECIPICSPPLTCVCVSCVSKHNTL
jgi:acyl-CoA synthetase (AMP-forming)/AMP-acid ligase II